MSCENLDGQCAKSWCNCDQVRARKASSALPLSKLQGGGERSRLATCSLPVCLVEDVATLMHDCAPQVSQWQAQWLVYLSAKLRAHAARATERQPEENTVHEPRPTE